MSKNVMVIGTGTIGEPLIGLLAEHKDALGLDNVVFFKRIIRLCCALNGEK